MNKRIFVLGEALVDCIEQADGQLKPILGGSPFNLARAAALQDASVTYLNPLSQDAYGGQFAQRLEGDGVKFNAQRSHLPTSLALIRLRDGQPDYSFYREGVADRDYSMDSVLQRIESQAAGILHTGSLALLPPDHSKVMTILERARAWGWTISVDVNLRPRVAIDLGNYLAAVQAVIPYADWIKASDEDLELLGFENPSPERASTIAKAWMAKGASHVALTFGGQGACLFVGNQHAIARAAPVEVVDTVGAGDTFWGTCLADWATEPNEMEQRVALTLQRAVQAAAINCGRQGCQPPTRAELMQNSPSVIT